MGITIQRFRILLFSGLMIVLGACGTSRDSKNTDAIHDRPPDIIYPDFTISLVDHLRTVPGVQVFGNGPGATVRIRGVSSIYSSTEPLFVVDGFPLQGGLQNASRLVPVNEIKSIRVLKNADETGIYGVRGGNGVIEIELKKE